MIAVVDYSPDAGVLAGFVKECGIACVLTNNELEISRADCVILPHAPSIPAVVRKLHMLNLFGFIRLLKKPILGVCGGVQLLCEFSGDTSCAALGFLPGTGENGSLFSGKAVIKNTGTHSLLTERPEFEVTIPQLLNFPKNNLTTFTPMDFPETSAVIEKERCFGIQFAPELSGEAGREIIHRFSLLHGGTP